MGPAQRKITTPFPLYKGTSVGVLITLPASQLMRTIAISRARDIQMTYAEAQIYSFTTS